MDIYVVSTNARQPRKAYASNTIDLFFDIDEEIYMEPGVVYQMPTATRCYSLRKHSTHADLILIPRSSSSEIDSLSGFLNPEAYLDTKSSFGECSKIKVYSKPILHLANTVGYIDWNYRGEVFARVYVDKPAVIKPDRPYLQLIPRSTETNFIVVDSFSKLPPNYIEESERGAAGFGSSTR